MIPNEPTRIRQTVETVLKQLVGGSYQAIEELTRTKQLTSAQIEAAVAEYGGTLIMPPDAVLAKLDVIQVRGEQPPRYSVRCDLYTSEEGRSDLTLELTLIDNNPNAAQLEVEIDGIHVL